MLKKQTLFNMLHLRPRGIDYVAKYAANLSAADGCHSK